ncbi:MAG: PKD domain-containing protein, partial [Planctomycetes bacterium]|nr:PKD domain-containing protein [Planctomycetota bacterium]
MMTAWNGARVGRWTINRRILLLALLAPLALTGCPETNTPSGNGDPAGGGVDENVAPNPLLNTPGETLAQGDTLQGQVGETLFFDAAGSVDTDGSVIGYEWDFGDGSPVETAVSVTHSYAATGE